MVLFSIMDIFAYMVFYGITGMGLGFVAGIAAGNIMGARGKQTMSDKYAESKKAASTHNSQWHPSHEKWQKEVIDEDEGGSEDKVDPI